MLRKYQNVFFLIACAILCYITFYNSLDNAFLMDDHALIVRNNAIRDPGFLQINIFTKNNDFTNVSQHVYYRPVTQILNYLSFLLFGKEAFGYHVLNLVLFFLCASSLYYLMVLIFNRKNLAFLTTLLFCLHPINGILVNYITMTGYAVMILAMNISLIAFLKEQKYFKVLSLMSFLIALLCHETAIMLPFYLISILWLVKGYSFKKSWVSSLGHLFILALFFIFRSQVASLKSNVIDHIALYDLNIGTFLATFANLIGTYLKNMFLLKNIVLIWSTDVVRDNIGWRSGVFLALIVMCIIGVFQYRRKKEQSLGLAWFLLGLVPITLACFSRPSLGIIFEPHWLFFSSIGIFIVIANLLLKVYDKIQHKLGLLFITIVLGACLMASWQYNELWGDEKKYCHYMLSLSPGMSLATWWLADAYLQDKNYPKAKAYFQKILNGRYGDWRAYLNLGLIEQELGQWDAAIDLYQKTIQINKNAALAYNNLAVIFMNQNDLEQAKKYLYQAVAVDHYALEARKNLISIFLEENNVNQAKQLAEDVLAIDPNDQYSLKVIQR